MDELCTEEKQMVNSKKQSRPRPTNNEIRLNEDQFIVSKTDTQSHILYINRRFMQISGFTEEELLNHPHNLIRHPDMPKGVFKLLWQTLKTGEEFIGYVKNICKDGSFYWVYAHVTPDYDLKGKVKGYYSVRRAPTRKAVTTIEKLYAQMLKAEQNKQGEQASNASIALLENFLAQEKLSYFQFVHQLDNPEIHS